MLTLAFIDQLTPGGVTNGHRVAGTGTIEMDGSIGMVGGIPQKAYAVSRTEADVFFVPAEAAEAAAKAAPTLNIVAVSHIDEVLDWLNKHNRP
jgi:PDZ domain-containing protein